MAVCLAVATDAAGAGLGERAWREAVWLLLRDVASGVRVGGGVLERLSGGHPGEVDVVGLGMVGGWVPDIRLWGERSVAFVRCVCCLGVSGWDNRVEIFVWIVLDNGVVRVGGVLAIVAAM